MPQQDAAKKTVMVSKPLKEKQVQIVKHFQPNTYKDTSLDLPEVDNKDEVVEDYLNKLNFFKQFNKIERKPRCSKEVYSRNRVINKSSNKYKLKSCITQKSEPFLTRSSSLDSKQYESGQQNIIVSSSSPSFNDTYVQNLKKEISQNGYNTWIDTKIYLMQKNEIHNQKVKHLREEINKIINIDMDMKKNKVAELKAEISNFRKNESVTVFNLETHLSTEGSDKDSKSKEADDSGSGNEGGSENEPSAKLKLVVRDEDEANEIEIKSTDLTERPEKDGTEDPSCRKLCLVEHSNNKPSGVQVPHGGDMTNQEDFIKAKIQVANILIDRVKDTLSDIKNKSKKNLVSVDTSKYSNVELETDDVVITKQICEADNEGEIELSRPKTRRQSCDLAVEVEDKFKNTLNDLDEKVNDSLDLLQSKLNTIIEQAETDSNPEVKSIEDNKATLDDDIETDLLDSDIKDKSVCLKCCAVQTEAADLSTKSSAVQTKPKPQVSVKVQSTHVFTNTVAIQTEKMVKKFCLESNCIVEIPPVSPVLHKIHNLNVQHLPSVDIKGKLKVQEVLKFYIDQDGITHVSPQHKDKNSRFYELSHFPDEINRMSSDSSFYINASIPSHKYPTTNLGLLGSVSDGELVNNRRRQLKSNSWKPKLRVSDKLKPITSKEIILKSFHIYDNPNFHDPCDMNWPLKVNSMDTFVYKTYINPAGIPPISSISSHRIATSVTPETLQKISQHNNMSRNSLSTTDIKKSKSRIRQSNRMSVGVNTLQKKAAEATFSKKHLAFDSTASKAQDLGLSLEKSTQVDSELEPLKVKEEPSKHYKQDSGSVCPSESSFEKISITVSYSTEDSRSYSDSSITESINNMKITDHIVGHERELKNSEHAKEHELCTRSTRGSQDTFHILKEKFAKEGYKHDSSHVRIAPIPESEPFEENISMCSAVPQFISGLTESTTTDLKKILPHIRKNVNDVCQVHHNSVDTNNKKNKSDKDFTVLSMQVHGDFIPDSNPSIDSPLKLGKNGRYKDEEDLFCDSQFKLNSVPLRRRSLKTITKSMSPNRHAVDLPCCDPPIVDPTLSEGEIKCHSRTSVGEIYRRGHSDKTRTIPNNHGSDANIIRERRIYFNNLITYYVNKNTKTPLLSQSSSSSGT